MKYKHLFRYLASKLQKYGSDRSYHFTSKFAKKHNLSFDHLISILSDLGGCCDRCILFNVAGRGYEEDTIGQETFLTPVDYAMEHNLYAHCLVNGVPADLDEAWGADEGGDDDAQFDVPCQEEDAYAYPDRTRAIIALRGLARKKSWKKA